MPLRRLLLNKKSVVVVGVAVVVMVGVGGWLRSPSEVDKETYAIIEHYLNEDESAVWTIRRARVNYNCENKRDVVGSIFVDHIQNDSWPNEIWYFDAELEKEDCKWTITELDAKTGSSLWDRIKTYLSSFLP